MKVAGTAVLNAPVERVWDALLDPAVLVGTIPGCERLEVTGDNQYALTVTAGVASIRGTYAGSCELRDLDPHRSLLLKASGSGAPGTVGAEVRVSLTDRGDGTTELGYDADAVVGGMIGGVGQRMLTSVSKRMAGEFFSAVDDVLTGSTAPAAVAAGGAGAGQPVVGTAAGPAVFTAPARPGRPDDFLTGIAVGAALVTLGVLLGRRLGPGARS
jgi:carbon monoxide dehydrogenase subunit G